MATSEGTTDAPGAARRPPLAGLRVVDSTDGPGELCGRILADLGADVVRTEPPGGAASRRLPPFAADGTSLWFAVRNMGKRSVTLDPADEGDRAALHRLLAGADVWIEGHRPGGLAAALGLDHDGLLARHPHLVVTSVTGFGLTGPYRDYLATDDVLVAMSGLLCRSGVVGRPPLLPPGSLAADTAAVAATFATLAALWQRRRTGRGQHVDLAAVTALAQIADWALPNWSAMTLAGGVYSAVRAGSGPVYPLYPCADGYVRLVVLSARQWHALRAWLGEPDHLQDPHWDGLLARMSIQEDILDPLYVELFSRYTAADLAAEAQRRGIVMTPVLKPAEVLTTPHFRERGTFAEVEAARGVRGAVATGFFVIDGERVARLRRAPDAGEHREAVLPDRDPDGRPPGPRQGPGAAPPSPPPESSAPSPPFAGLRVLDFGHGGVGVEAGRLLADYGADVVKVESRTYPDFIRTISGGDMSPSFASSSRGKRSFGVDVKDPRGLEVVHRLVRWADVVIENNSTGTMADLGLDYERLSALNPRLVMLSSQLMGATGPWKDWIGYGPSTRPAGGMTHLWSFSEDEMPPGAGVIHPDHLVGRLVAVGAVAALLGRDGFGPDDGPGRGAHVEVAQVEAVVGLLADLFLRESLAPGSVRPEGNARPHGAPWGVYPCAGEERWCVICVRHDDDWDRLRRALGDPEWARGPELATVEGRLATRAELDERLGAWTAARTDREVTEVLQAAGVPAGFMAYPADVAEDPHFVARGYPQRLDQPGVGPMVMEGPAFAASGMPAPVARPAPGLGAHTREICREVLGMDAAAVDELVAAGTLHESLHPVQETEETVRT